MLGYEQKRVLVVGGATGMGAAAAQRAAELGAEVTVLDVAEVAFPVKESIRVDLRSEEEVEAAIRRLDGPFHALFSCAGVANGVRGLALINFISQRRIIEGLIAKGGLGRGSAIGMISSVAGLGWQEALPQLKEFLAIADWKAQAAWVEAHRTDDFATDADGYSFSKRAMCAYVAMQAMPLITQGIRINSILPGPTDTPLARANDFWLAYAADYRKKAGLADLQPRDMGDVLIFLCSPMASGLNGENIIVDQGSVAAEVTGVYQR